MSDQFLSLYEETTRGTAPGSPSRKFLPIVSGIAPKFTPKDDSVKEYRGPNTAQGDVSVRRLSAVYSWSPEFRRYPGGEIGLILKHFYGHAGTRSLIDTSAYRGILYPLEMPFGTGAALASKALGLEPNLDRDGTTASQTYGGFRAKKLTIDIKPDADVIFKLDGGGAGDWIGAANQTETAGVSFPTTTPYLSSDAKFYVGSGATLTGTAPDYTNIVPGTMTQFQPDDCTITITNGIDDKPALNGVKGASKTERTGQVVVEVDFTVDFRDPSSGFSSVDEFEAQFSGPRTSPFMVLLDNGVLAGAATETYKDLLYVPSMHWTYESPDYPNDGKQAKVKVKGRHLVDAAIGKALIHMTVDKSASY